jgi:hypothetical protein
MKRLCTVLLGSLLLGLLNPALADGPIAPRFATGHITPEEWAQYLEEIKAKPGVHCEDAAANQYICDSSAERTIWVFTREGHAAHPAVSRGVMIATPTAQGTTLGIDRSGHYAGDKVAFDAWIKEFAKLDRRQVEQWSQALQR